MKVVKAALAALVLAAPAGADTVGPLVARWQAGVVCPSEFGRGRNAADDISFIAQTQVVPAVIGMGFGIRAQVTPPEGLSRVQIVVEHPPFTPGGPTSQNYTTSISGTGMSGFFYRFEEAREVVPGTWRILALANGAPVYDIDFNVVPARTNDGLLRSCGVQ